MPALTTLSTPYIAIILGLATLAVIVALARYRRWSKEGELIDLQIKYLTTKLTLTMEQLTEFQIQRKREQQTRPTPSTPNSPMW